MKYLALGFVVLFALTAFMAESSAVVCARGVYHAGCVAAGGGAAVVHRGVYHHGAYRRGYVKHY